MFRDSVSLLLFMATVTKELLGKLPFWVKFKPTLEDGTVVEDCIHLLVGAKESAFTWLDVIEKRRVPMRVVFDYERSWKPLSAEAAAQLPPAFLDTSLCTTPQGRVTLARLFMERAEAKGSLITSVHNVPMDRARISPNNAQTINGICVGALRTALTLALASVTPTTDEKK